jgi:hypothetical protein
MDIRQHGEKVMYLIYDKESTIIPAQLRDKRYKTMGAAKGALTRFNKAWAKTRGKLGNEPECPVFRYGIAEESYFHSVIEKKVQRTNLMSGEKYHEAVNTPPYMSPSCESYWSM